MLFELEFASGRGAMRGGGMILNDFDAWAYGIGTVDNISTMYAIRISLAISTPPGVCTHTG